MTLSTTAYHTVLTAVLDLVFLCPRSAVRERQEATRKLGVSRQTVLQRVKRGDLEVVHVTKGRKKGIRIKLITRQSELFDLTS
jgi:hypothetical protein